MIVILPRAAAGGVPGEVMEGGGEGVVPEGDQLRRDGRHLDREQTAPVHVHRLREVEPGLQDEAHLLARLLAPAQSLQHHLGWQNVIMSQIVNKKLHCL